MPCTIRQPLLARWCCLQAGIFEGKWCALQPWPDAKPTPVCLTCTANKQNYAKSRSFGIWVWLFQVALSGESGMLSPNPGVRIGFQGQQVAIRVGLTAHLSETVVEITAAAALLLDGGRHAHSCVKIQLDEASSYGHMAASWILQGHFCPQQGAVSRWILKQEWHFGSQIAARLHCQRWPWRVLVVALKDPSSIGIRQDLLIAPGRHHSPCMLQAESVSMSDLLRAQMSTGELGRCA